MNTSFAPVALFVIASAAFCWWVMQKENNYVAERECRPAILYQETPVQYEWTAYHGRCLE